MNLYNKDSAQTALSTPMHRLVTSLVMMRSGVQFSLAAPVFIGIFEIGRRSATRIMRGIEEHFVKPSQFWRALTPTGEIT